MISTEEIIDIACRSSFIDERLARCRSSRVAAHCDADELITRWRYMLSPSSDPTIFARRLRLAGTTEPNLPAALSHEGLYDENTLPDWTAILEELAALLPSSYDMLIEKLPAGLFDSENDLPYQHVWAPWLIVCLERLQRKAGPLYSLLCERSAVSWLRYILKNFNANFALCLTSAFDLARYDDLGFFSMPSPASLPAGSVERYRKFANGLLAGEWKELLKRYPVMARLLATSCIQQTDYFAKALSDLDKDISRLGRELGNGAAPGKVSNISAGLSDQHNGGRSVIRFEFESGLTAYYKPRSGGVDLLWSDLLAWFEGRMPGLRFRTPAQFDGDRCTWVEDIRNAPLDSPGDAGAFYYKAGCILAIIYVLGGTDFHQENLIACGKDPVLIDLETLLRPLVRLFDHAKLTDDDRAAYESLEGDSVLRTCLLPMWTPISSEVSRDYGAFTPDDNAPYTVPEWLDVNTDRMRRGQVERKNNPSPNVAHFGGELVSVIAHRDDIAKGFEDAYRLVMNAADEFTGEGGPLKKFHASVPMRYLPRQSQVYADMINRLRSPGLMRDGAAFSIEVEGLSRAFISIADVDRIEAVWRIFEAEKRALLQLNIPLFEFTAGGRGVYDAGEKIADGYFLFTAIEEAERRVKKLNRDDLEFQSHLADASLQCRYPDAGSVDETLKIASTRDAVSAERLSKEGYIAAAKAIAEDIVGRAITRRGKPQWLTLKSDPVRHIHFIGPVDTTIYEGSTGIGLFLGAYEKVSGDDTHHDFAIRCFAEVLEMLEDEKNLSLAIDNSSGYCSGIPGIVWALYNSAKYLKDERLMAAANKCVALLNSKPASKDRAFDVIGGSAGSALVLMALHEKYRDDRLLTAAVEFSESLLEKRMQFEKWKLWPSPHAYKPLTGFAHGAAGFALILAKAFARTGDERFREAALSAMEYETAEYYPKHHNWPDFRQNRDLKKGETAFMAGWCSGAPGIGLARLHMPEVFRDERLAADIDNAIAFTKGLSPSHVHRDHLCCGYAGRIDFLIEAASVLGRQEIFDDAAGQFAFIAGRARLNGRYTLSVDDSKTVFTPGLFTGLAGIGMTALRLADHGAVASPLMPS